MIRAWLVYNKEDAIKNNTYIDWFIEEARKQGITMELIIRNELMVGIKNNRVTVLKNGEETTLPDLAVVRTIDPIFSSHLEEMGVLVFNSSRVARICNHKSLTHREVQKLSIPMVDTYFYKSNTLPEKPPLNFPFVMKSAHGRGGLEVLFINSYDTWNRSKKILSSGDIVIQTANVQRGKDLRVFIVGKEIVACVLRESTKDFRANFTLGGTASLYPLNSEEIRMIKKICNHFDFDMVGVDFLIDKEGNLLFNEIEDVVGSRTLSKLTDINLLEKYTTHIYKKWTSLK